MNSSVALCSTLLILRVFISFFVMLNAEIVISDWSWDDTSPLKKRGRTCRSHVPSDQTVLGVQVQIVLSQLDMDKMKETVFLDLKTKKRSSNLSLCNLHVYIWKPLRVWCIYAAGLTNVMTVGRRNRSTNRVVNVQVVPLCVAHFSAASCI